ncbi:hypothetical protein, partial [Mesorhizobium sp. M4A.F.Ca.ET.090.04.2.1]|uniref:hypothetical protein n=1 Tax=Mesorhizobium sp. M4A.F.Ca.ET.090.04.2.1 TaxID=2496663 RepID=UPI0016786DFD
LEQAQPNIEVSLQYGVEPSQTVFRVDPVPAEARKAISSFVIRQNPSQDDDSPFIFRRDYSYGDRYREYRTKVVPAYAASVHRFLEVQYGQVPFAFCLKNLGDLQAESLVIKLISRGGSLHNRFTCYPIFGPPAPRPKSHPLDGIRFNANSIRSPIGRHDMHFAVGPDRGQVIEIHCADFRHGRSWEFEGIATIDPHSEGPFVIDVEVTASNMRGIQGHSFDLAYTVENAKVSDLVDLLKRTYRAPIPMRDRYNAEVKAKNWGWMEVVDVDGQEQDPDEDDDFDDDDQGEGDVD